MQIKAIVSAISVALGIVLSTEAISAQAEFCDNRVTDREMRTVPYLAKPAPMGSYIDPAFGTQVTRISGAEQGEVVKTMYNTVQAWNADESKLILYHTGTSGPGHHLYNGQTYEHIRKLDINPSDLEEVFWDPKSAEHLFYIQSYPVSDEFYDTLVRYNVETEAKEVVADLGEYCGHPESAGGSATSGSDVQGMYGDHIGVRCNNSAFNSNTTDKTFLVNVRSGEISDGITIDPSQPVGDNDFGFAYNIALSPTPSNERVLLQGSVFDADMNLLHSLDLSQTSMYGNDGSLYTIPSPEHNTIGSLPNGRDAMYSAIFDPGPGGCNNDANQGVGSIVSYDLETGDCKVVVGESNGWGYPQSGTHVSSISSQNPGWVLMSTIGYGSYQYFSKNEKAPVLFSEVSLTFADDDEPKTCRLAHSRTYAKDAENTSGYSAGYFGEPHPVLSPSGTRVLFNSDWYDSGSVDVYVIDLNVEGENMQIEVATDTNADTDTDTGVESGEISTSKPVYILGEDVLVSFSEVSGSADDWVSIAPVGSPDGQMNMWLYTNGSQTVSGEGLFEGQLSFNTEYLGLGEFEARYFEQGSGVASNSSQFVVTEAPVVTPSVVLSSSQEIYTMGEPVVIDFADASGSGTDWISIAPVGSPLGQMNVWTYSNGTQTGSAESPTSGSVSFYSEYIGIGEFEARFFVSDSFELSAAIPFEISATAPAEITTSKEVYTLYDNEVLINFEGASGSGTDWVSIAPAGSPDGQMNMWLYTNGSQSSSQESPLSGSLSFYREYIGVGQFEARLFLNDSNTVSARVFFEITDTQPAVIEASKAVYTYADQYVEINFSGAPGSGSDWIGIAPKGSPLQQTSMWIYTNGSQSSSAKSQEEGSVSFYTDYLEPGDYEARLFFTDSYDLQATVDFTVSEEVAEPSGGVSISSIQSYTLGEIVNISFDGATDSGTNWVGLAPAGSPPEQSSMWLYTNGTQSASTTGPEAGDLEFYSDYLGQGEFEARLYFDESNDIEAMVNFTIE